MRVKLHRSYTVPELALCCGVHKNTVRHWQAKGLEPVDSSRPALFQGATVRAFLAKAKASRKRPCPPGTLYCLRWAWWISCRSQKLAATLGRSAVIAKR